MIYKSPSLKKRQKHFQKFSSQTGSHSNASNQLAGVTSLYQTSRLVTRLFKNEMIQSNSFTKPSCSCRTTWNLMFHLQKHFFTQRCLLIVPNHRGEQNVLFDFLVNIQSLAVIAPKLFAHYDNQISALSRKVKGYSVVLQIKYLLIG